MPTVAQTVPAVNQTMPMVNQTMPMVDQTLPGRPARAPANNTIVTQTMPISGATTGKTRAAGNATTADVHLATQIIDSTGASPTRADMPMRKPTTSATGLARQTLGGYRIVGELGKGAMGAVYHAKQLSLDRDVALKVIQAQYASDPVFIARFTREAYAAAQLTHHNVVQIYDLGADGDTNFFSMEFVKGETLADLVERNGKLDVDAAVGYVLQAARGLQFAHNQGMVHRDIKPGNLMINTDGIVKVADLGLVKTQHLADLDDDNAAAGANSPSANLIASTADVTNFNVAMGTPAFMAPEQAENAAGVDHRADIYSLGCTLYALVTGQPPFTGTTAIEVMTKHKSEPMVRPEVLVKRVPTQLSDIIMKMVAKSPTERYANLGQVIDDLESYLGVKSSGPFSPTDEHAQILEDAIHQYNGSAMAKLHSLITLGFFAAVAVCTLIALFFDWRFAAGFAFLGVETAVTYFVVSGYRDRTYMFDKYRSLLAGTRRTDWMTWIGAALLVLLALFLLGLLPLAVGFAILGTGLGAALHFVIDRGVASQRRAPIDAIEKMLRGLRLRGVEEESLRQFVAKYGGNRWEEVFEALFGFEAKLKAREQIARTEQGRRNRRFRAWREPIIKWLDAHVRANQERRERKHLEKIETANLRAQGMSPAEARRNAQQMADAIIDEAAETRVAATQASPEQVDPAAARTKKRNRQKAMLDEARSGQYSKKRRGLSAISGLLGMVVGPKARFVLGGLLVAGCVLWMRQNGLLTSEQLADVTAGAIKGEGVGEALVESTNQKTEALKLPVVGALFDSFNPGAAGLVLIISAMFQGWRMSIFVLPAAVVMCFGAALRIPGIDAIGGAQMSSLVIGLAIAVVGLFFGRTPDP